MADGVFDHAVVGKVAAEEPDLVGAVGFVGHPDEAVGAHAEQLGAVVVAVLDAQTEPGRGPPDLAACDVQLVLLRPPLDLLQRRPAFLCQSHLALRSPKTKGYQLMRRPRANIAQRPPNIKALSVWLVRVAAASGACRWSGLRVRDSIGKLCARSATRARAQKGGPVPSGHRPREYGTTGSRELVNPLGRVWRFTWASPG